MNHSSKNKDNQKSPEFHRIEKDQNLYRQIFEHSNLSIIIHDLEMNIISANKKTIDLFGFSREELLSKKVFELHTETELEHAAEVLDKMKEIEKHTAETRFKRKDGSVFHAKVTPTKFLIEGKPVIHVYIEDITERKKHEAKLVEATLKAEESERLQAAFLANMSHEIRTPLTAIIGFSSFLKQPGINEESVKKYAEIIGDSGEHLLALINDIIDLSKFEAGKIELFKTDIDLHDLFEELYTFFLSYLESKNKPQLRLKLNIPETNTVILSDDTRLRQILINLIGNAIKFTEKGMVEFGYSIKEDTLIFFVKDTGIGIDEEYQDIIFDRFKQGTSSDDKFHSGTGLGLSISKAFVELLDGKIWFESEKDKGTNFYFTIDYQEGKEKEKKEFKEVEFIFNNEVILVAEDDENNFEFLKKLLEDNNLEVLRAANGKECIQKVEADRGIDLVLMDIQMPELSGIKAVEKIKEIRPDLPVIAQSAYLLKDNESGLKSSGFDELISKPINNMALLKTLKNYI